MRRDVERILPAADLGVLASHEEGFSNAVLEIMATGLPVVVTDVGGNAEAVPDGECGRVVPPRAPAALAAAIVELAGDLRRRRTMGAAARRRVADRFSVEVCVDRYLRLYASLRAGEVRDIEGVLVGDRGTKRTAPAPLGDVPE